MFDSICMKYILRINASTRCACASEVYGSVFVCVCVCRLLQDQRSASKSFYSHVFLDFNSSYLECIVANSAKLVHVVLLLYLAASSALENASYW